MTYNLKLDLESPSTTFFRQSSLSYLRQKVVYVFNEDFLTHVIVPSYDVHNAISRGYVRLKEIKRIYDRLYLVVESV